MDTKELGRRLAARRKRQKMTQRHVGQLVGLTIGQISRIEHGRREPPLPTFLLLARVLGASPSTLLDGIVV